MWGLFKESDVSVLLYYSRSLGPIKLPDLIFLKLDVIPIIYHAAILHPYILEMSTHPTALIQYGGWLSSSRLVHFKLICDLKTCAMRKAKEAYPHTPPVEKFKSALLADPEIVELWDKIFLQVSSDNKIDDFGQLLYMLDDVIVSPPRCHTAIDEQGKPIGEPIGVPMALLFGLFSNTSAGYDLFRRPTFNQALKDLLDSWGAYLTTPDSNKTLTTDDEGWFGIIGLQSLEKDRGEFNSTYVCPKPEADNRGYTSWDAFFTREFQSGVRPIKDPENKSLIHNGCESTVYRIAQNVKEHDQFWLKGQPYSVYDMLSRDSKAQYFNGGTVYQAFLDTQDYHRWHSPIDGTIVDVQVIPGTYFAALPDAGAEKDDPKKLRPGDPQGAILRSQAWITQSATRAIIYIQANNPIIGLVAFMAVGMVEISTCAPSVKSGQEVSVGDELGMFHFGGSSHVLIFGPQVQLTFGENVQLRRHQKLHSILAEASAA
jgi:phosphatidylserine decarboxylase